LPFSERTPPWDTLPLLTTIAFLICILMKTQ
jgi:hypothetical protein